METERIVKRKAIVNLILSENMTKLYLSRVLEHIGMFLMIFEICTGRLYSQTYFYICMVLQ